MRTIKAKSTATTRSILEARWAIFFREIGLKARYEPITLWHDKVRYTPDFEVEGLGFVEIKPTLGLFISESSERVRRIAIANPATSFYVFCGSNVGFDCVAMYLGKRLFAVTYPQMCVVLAKLRNANRFSKEIIQDGFVRRACAVANKTRFNEWQTAREIVLEVISSLEQSL